MKYTAQPKGDITNPRIFYFVESKEGCYIGSQLLKDLL